VFHPWFTAFCLLTSPLPCPHVRLVLPRLYPLEVGCIHEEAALVNILLVEDEASIAGPLLRALEKEGHALRWAADLSTGRAELEGWEPDLLILDVMLPESEEGGFLLAQEARAAGYAGMLLFMTARDAVLDRVRGLDYGGDDYLVKPFALLELLARVRALLRRGGGAGSSKLCYGPLELEVGSREVRYRGVRVDLSGREYALLERFALFPSRVWSSDELLERVWGEEGANLQVVKVYVHHLRQKLGPEVVRTVGRGYCLGLEAGMEAQTL